MKKHLALSLVLGALAWLGVPSAATAGDYGRHYGHGHGGHHQNHVFISGYRSCGTPIHTERYLIRHDRRGYPVWGHRVVHIHHHRPLPPPPVFVGRPVYVPPPPPVYCAPPPPVFIGRPVCEPPPRTVISASYGGGGVVFHGSFWR
jgi:hypothetical protein